MILLVGFAWACRTHLRLHRHAAADANDAVPMDVPLDQVLPQVPGVVRVYGAIIMVMSVIGMGLGVLQIPLGIAALASSALLFLPLVVGAGLIAVNFIFLRLGKGLLAGERQAVYGLCVLGGLAALSGMVAIAAGAKASGLGTIFWVGVFYVPPIVSAYRHWTIFK